MQYANIAPCELAFLDVILDGDQNRVWSFSIQQKSRKVEKL